MTRPIPIGITSATKITTTMTIVFNQAVSLTGVPAYTTNLAGVTATAVSMTNPTTLVLTFSASVATSTTLTFHSRTRPSGTPREVSSPTDLSAYQRAAGGPNW